MEINLTYGRDGILTSLREHQEAHVKNYQKAIKKYNKVLIQTLERKLKLAKNNKKVSHHINLPAPVLYAKEYDRLIDLFVRSTDESIKLTYADSRKIFHDEWHWRSSFMSNTMCYATGPQGSTGPEGISGSSGSDDEEGQDFEA